MADRLWSRDQSDPSHSDKSSGVELVYDKIHQLSTKDDAQRSLKLQALSVAVGLGQTRWLMYEQKQTTVFIPLVVALVFWLTISFISFGLFTPSNATCIATLFVSSLSDRSRFYRFWRCTRLTAD